MTRKEKRAEALMPGGIPRYVRIYDNDQFADRYTAVFGKKATVWEDGTRTFDYVGMSADPFHPQGVGVHGETRWQPCDVNEHGFFPAMGRSNHLGKRIPFAELPEPCKQLVLGDYRALWGI